MTDSAIDVEHLAKRYGDVDAVADLSLIVDRGSVFGFLGPNGAGKTTSLKLMLGLVEPTSGGGTLLGRALGDRIARAKLGYLPELFRYHDWLTAREELSFHAELIGIASRERRGAVARALALVGLTEHADRKIGTYSKGMQQRTGLGVALLGEPELVFLDEPTSALDPIGRAAMREIVGALKARGTTVFLNSHLLGEVERICDRVAIVNRGRIVAEGRIGDLLGDAYGVRLLISADGTPVEPIFSRHGSYRTDGDWHVVDSIARDDVPLLIRELVHAGAHIYAVEPARATLEQRFLEMLGTR